MKQELDQIAPTISENPFMKNDKMKKVPEGYRKSIQDNYESNPDNSDFSIDDELQALKKDDLKRELCSVLKGMRKNENKEQVFKNNLNLI